MALHDKGILGARRKNNIYGELDDYIAIKFLNLGGTGILYNKIEDSFVTFFATGAECSYMVYILYKENPDDIVPDFTKHLVQLKKLTEYVQHVPLYGIAHKSSKKVKFYFLDGKKVTNVT